jgi:GNAT superfamily N-acetyltransferase
LAGFEDLQSVGYCLILQEGDATELAELFIDEKYRGLGLSKKAMAYVLDTYPSDELYIMVHKPNTISQKLIQEYGFKPVAQESNNLIRFERYD